MRWLSNGVNMRYKLTLDRFVFLSAWLFQVVQFVV
jgi:hypothetical protein